MKANSRLAVLAAFAMLTAGSITDSVGAPLARYLDGTTGDPEKNTFGFVGDDLVLQPRAANLSDATQYVGARTGNEERDTFARVDVQPLLAADIRK